MPVEFSPSVVRARFPGISWPAIFAALAVGIAVQLMLTLAGFALGVNAAGAADDGSETITLAAASWGAVSMLIASLVGGYVAGRCSGLRRTGDGVLHGVVSWAATTLLYAALATTAIGGLTTGLFGLLGSDAGNAVQRAMSGNAAAADSERTRALDVLTEIGMSPEQARAVVDELTASRGERSASATTREAVRDAADAMGSATLWLAATVLLSLLLGIAGGILGVRGVRRMAHRTGEAVTSQPRILSKT